MCQVRGAGIRGAQEQVEIQESIYATPGRRRFRRRLEIDGEIHFDGAAGAVRSARTCPGYGGRRARSPVRYISPDGFAACYEEAAGVRASRQEEEGGTRKSAPSAAAPNTQASG